MGESRQMERLQPTEPLADPMSIYRSVDRSRPQGESWVLGHMVAGLDGTTAVRGRVGPLSTAPDQKLFRQMRELADVVLVGAETVRREGYAPIGLSPAAIERRVTAGRTPTPPVAVVSGSLDLDWQSSVFAGAPADARTLIVTSAAAEPEKLASAEQVADVVFAGQERVEARLAVAALADRGFRVVVCEGGPTWLGELVAAQRVDELCLSIAPLMGGDPLPVAVTPAGAGVTDFDLRHVLIDDGTLFLRYEAKALRR